MTKLEIEDYIGGWEYIETYVCTRPYLDDPETIVPIEVDRMDILTYISNFDDDQQFIAHVSNGCLYFGN